MVATLKNEKRITQWVTPDERIETPRGLLNGRQWIDAEIKRMRSGGCTVAVGELLINRRLHLCVKRSGAECVAIGEQED